MSIGIYLFGFVLGTVLGSFSKALADRTITKSSFLGRSYCPKCKKKLQAYDLIPVISYLITRGKCRYCGKKIGAEYPLTEIIFGILGGIILIKFVPADFLYLKFPDQSLIALDVIFKLFALCILGALFITDIKTGYLYDRLTISGIVIALCYLFLMSAYKVYLTYQAVSASVIGKYLLPPYSDYFTRHALIAADPLFSGCLAGLLMALFFGGLIILTKGRGMGGGDLKLGIFLGLVLGFPLSVVAIFLAFVSGSLISLLLVFAKKRNLRETIPFGPFLGAGAISALIWGQEIINWYLKFQ